MKKLNEIKILRHKLNLTVRELSEISGVASGYISTLENDENGTSNPSKVVMTKIAEALNSTVSEVFFKNNGKGGKEFESTIVKY